MKRKTTRTLHTHSDENETHRQKIKRRKKTEDIINNRHIPKNCSEGKEMTERKEKSEGEYAQDAFL